MILLRLASLADDLDRRQLHKEANEVDNIIQSFVSFDKPARIYYDNDADGLFSAFLFKYYSGANVISMVPISAGFELRREDNVMSVVLDARTKAGNEDLRIDHHEGGIIKPTDIVDTSAPSCAGLVASIFDVSVDPQVLREMNNLDSGKPTIYNWDQAEKKMSFVPQAALESWDEFEKLMEKVGIQKMDLVSIQSPGPIEEVGSVRAFGNWDMPGVETDKYVGYFINTEYPRGEAFTVLGRMYSDKRPDEPYQIFIANSPARKDLNIGGLISQMKQQYGFENGGGRADVGGCNFKDEQLAQKVYEAILNAAK